MGNALKRNPWAPSVPCHRVVSSSGFLGGYAFGQRKKIALLQLEGVRVSDKKIVDFKDKLFQFNK